MTDDQAEYFRLGVANLALSSFGRSHRSKQLVNLCVTRESGARPMRLDHELLLQFRKAALLRVVMPLLLCYLEA